MLTEFKASSGWLSKFKQRHGQWRPNMSRRDAESQALERWLRQLGYPAQLQSEEIQRLLSPNMRSIWRHLNTCVKPVRSIETIRKNLLLAKLQKENTKPNEIGNFNIQSCEELTVVKRVSNAQREINSKNIERKDVDEEIKSLIFKIAQKKYNIRSKNNTIREIVDKTTLMNLKLVQFKREIEKLEDDNSKAKVLEMFKESCSNTEDSSNVSNIATCLLKNKISSFESECEEDVLLSLSNEYSVKNVYQAFLLASDSTYKSLKRFITNLESPEEDMKGLVSNEGLSFSTHLKHLNVLIIHNQLSIVDIEEKVKKGKGILEGEKRELINLIKGMCINTNHDFYEDPIIEAEEFMEKLVNNSILSTKAITEEELIVELDAECFEYDDLRQLVEKRKNEENELQNEVRLKVTLISGLYSKIYKYNFKIDKVKTEILEMCNESVSKFLSEMLKHKDLESIIFASQHTTIDEIKMFHNVPLSALTRRWENVTELLPKELIEELSTNPELCVFLLQSEPKNILSSVLEKKWWSYSLRYKS